MNTEVLLAMAAIALVYFVSRFLSNGRHHAKRAREAIASGALVVDVRSKAEYDDGHFPGSVNLPAGQVQEHLSLLGDDTSKLLLVYCASGLQSSKVKRELEALGWTRVVDAGSYRALPLPPQA